MPTNLSEYHSNINFFIVFNYLSFFFQKALASVFTYTKNGLNTEATFDVKVLANFYLYK